MKKPDIAGSLLALSNRTRMTAPIDVIEISNLLYLCTRGTHE